MQFNFGRSLWIPCVDVVGFFLDHGKRYQSNLVIWSIVS
jgi:hypothetical protein